jgi:hypothetical protein
MRWIHRAREKLIGDLAFFFLMQLHFPCTIRFFWDNSSHQAFADPVLSDYEGSRYFRPT